MKGVIFDYDGTLHESIRIYSPAFRRAYEYMVENGHAPQREWSDLEIGKWLGYSIRDMWNEFMPGLDEYTVQNCSDMIGESMLELTACGMARLYEGSLEILELLKSRGYTLIFLSNCKTSYMNAHIQAFHLERYFDGFYCTQQYDFAPKHEIFSHIISEHPAVYAVAGDRFQDMEIAKKHNLLSVGCTYGYGEPHELEDADFRISDIRELRDILR